MLVLLRSWRYTRLSSQLMLDLVCLLWAWQFNVYLTLQRGILVINEVECVLVCCSSCKQAFSMFLSCEDN